jgi:hypothetical protein
MNYEWETICLQERGRVLTGKKRHYCMEWDGLPIDETTPEWPCGCPAEDESYDADHRLQTEGDTA